MVTLVVALIRGALLPLPLLLVKLLIGASLGLKLLRLLNDGCVLDVLLVSVKPFEPVVFVVLLGHEKLKGVLLIGD